MPHFAFYKPYGTLSQFINNGRGKRHHRLIGDWGDFPEGTMAVGRLDRDSEGLLLLTTDGHFSEAIRSKSVDKEYWVQVDGYPTDDALQQMREGVELSHRGQNYQTRPCTVQRISSPNIPTRSKAIPCTAEHVTAVVNTNFIIEVYKGTSRDPSTDTLVGTAIFGAEKWNGLKLEGAGDSIQRVLQYPGGVECALPVTLKTASNDGEEAQEPPLKSAPTVTVKVVADETLLQFCRGGRTFTALTSSVYLTNENGERAENVAAAWNLNDAENNSWEQEEFTIECSAPCNGSLEVSSVAGGRLCKQEAQTTADTEVEGGEKKEERKTSRSLKRNKKLNKSPFKDESLR